MSPENSEAYAAAVGERWERYQPRFERFARGEQERHGRMPSRIEELVTEPLGRLAALSLESDGTVRASFGAQASKLAGRSVSFTPLRQEGRIVDWVCRSDLPDRCVPQACRRAS